MKIIIEIDESFIDTNDEIAADKITFDMTVNELEKFNLIDTDTQQALLQFLHNKVTHDYDFQTNVRKIDLNVHYI